jgi:hypothetical protein
LNEVCGCGVQSTIRFPGWVRVFLLSVVVLALEVGCGGGESTANGRPCVVSEEKMASLWDVPKVNASPQDNGYECIYAADDRRIVSLAVRSSGEFEAERARFEDQGFLLPPLEPVDGVDGEANVDPRYNSLNVIAGDLVVSVQLLGTEPADPAEQLAIENRIAGAAVGQLS